MSCGAMPGEGNCDVWTLNDAGAMGTMAWLSWGNQLVHVWSASTEQCNSILPVWCVEDRARFLVYLPSILRSYAPGR